MAKDKPCLEDDLKASSEILEKVKNDEYANSLYCALCNNEFDKNGIQWSCTWRYSGGLVARLRAMNECYLDYYCNGNEGFISDEIKEDLLKLGWTGKPIQI